MIKKKARKDTLATDNNTMPQHSTRPSVPTYVQTSLFQAGGRIRKAVSDGYKRPAPIPVQKTPSTVTNNSMSNSFGTSSSSMSSDQSTTMIGAINPNKRVHDRDEEEIEEEIEEDNFMLNDLEKEEGGAMEVTMTDSDLEWIRRNGFETPKFLTQ